MSIKQNGGVFGRNPTFNDVTIDDLTANSLVVNGPSTISQNDGSKLTFKSTDATITGGQVIGDIEFFSSDESGIGAAARANIAVVAADAAGAGDILFKTSTGGALPAEAMKIASNKNVTVSTGNLVIGTSGKGIDFSATAGTGTSELLDDYEEGVWTPVFSDASSGGNTATGSASGYYIKVGGLVYVTGQFENVTTTGMTGGNLLYVQGIPYTPTSVGNDIFFMGSVKADGVTNSGFVNVESVDSYAWLRFAETNGATGGHLTVSDFASGTADIFFSLCYRSIL